MEMFVSAQTKRLLSLKFCEASTDVIGASTVPSYQKHLSPERSIGLATRAEFGDAVWPMRISANVTDDFGNVTGLSGRC